MSKLTGECSVLTKCTKVYLLVARFPREPPSLKIAGARSSREANRIELLP
jgi:hypothetical protein